MPHFVTSEGDELVLARACYRHNEPDKIRQVLESLDEFDLGDDSSPEADGSVRFGWYEIQPDPRSHAPLGDGRRILATLTLASTTLEVEAMSQQRLDNCCRRLEQVLGDRIRLLETDVKDVRRAMREEARRPRSEPEEPFIPPPEFIAEMEEKMLRRWIDESIPALGGLTPREAVKTPEGRQQVLDLLDYIGRQQSRVPRSPGMFSPDYRKAKKMLGLE